MYIRFSRKETYHVFSHLLGNPTCETKMVMVFIHYSMLHGIAGISQGFWKEDKEKLTCWIRYRENGERKGKKFILW